MTLARTTAEARGVPATDRVGGGAEAEQPVAVSRATAETLVGVGMGTVVEAGAPGVAAGVEAGAPGVEAGGLTRAKFHFIGPNALGIPAAIFRTTRLTRAVDLGVRACIAIRFWRTMIGCKI